MKKLLIYVNEEVVHEIERDETFDEEQLIFLNKIDADMDLGIKIQGELLSNPDREQRAHFILMNLIVALQHNNDAIISASNAYLVSRFPLLVEAHATDNKNSIKITLIED